MPLRNRAGIGKWAGTPTNLLMSAALLISLLTATGLAGFWLFYQSVDFFDHI